MGSDECVVGADDVKFAGAIEFSTFYGNNTVIFLIEQVAKKWHGALVSHDDGCVSVAGEGRGIYCSHAKLLT